MTPIFQDKFGADGNCFSACLASLLELDISDVPNFYDIGGAENVAWWNAVRDWLEGMGFGLVVMQLPSIECIDYLKGVHIVSGETVRGGGVLHATLWENGKMIHDPHPEGDGLTSLVDVCFLYPLDAAKCYKALVLTASKGGVMENKCTECEFGTETCGVGSEFVESSGLSDDNGIFCIRCGHAPECHDKASKDQ